MTAGKKTWFQNSEDFKQRENTLKTLLSDEPIDRRHQVDHVGLGCKPGLTAWRAWNGCLAGLSWGGEGRLGGRGASQKGSGKTKTSIKTDKKL
jgi:hypothetical protein